MRSSAQPSRNSDLRGMDVRSGPGRQCDAFGQRTSKSQCGLQTSRFVTSSVDDSFRPALRNTSSHTPWSIGSSSGKYDCYHQESTSAPSTNRALAGMAGYGVSYAQDSRRPSLSSGDYKAATMVYDAAQPSAQSAYDIQKLWPLQRPAIQIVPADRTSRYFSTEASSAYPSSLQQPVPGSDSPSNFYQQNPPMSYTSDMLDVGVGSEQEKLQMGAGGCMSKDPDYSEHNLKDQWHEYQRQLATVIDDITEGSLESASETLLTISEWLLSQVENFGLTNDDSKLHDERKELWNNLNHTWLALGQRQINMMQSGQKLARRQRLLPKETIVEMGYKIVGLSDGLERHALIDYQFGLWEDDIIAVLEDCLDLAGAKERLGRGDDF